jgi:hypothetical protein
MWRIRTENESVTWFSFLEITVSVVKQWAHWMWRTLLYWIFLSSEFLRFILWFLCQLIQSSAMKRSSAWSHSKEKTSWRWRFVIHDCECLSSCEKSCVSHARHACFRFINREVDHFDRFKIEIESFVRFFLKFIENDRLSWMKNAVNSDWWMRKWVVDKTKMKRWKVFDLKNCFFSLVFAQASSAIHSSLFIFQTIFENSWSFSSCRLCENLLFLWTSSSSIVFFRIRWRSFSTKRKIRSAVNAVSNFWRWSLFLSAFLMLIDRFAIVVRL